MIRRPARRLRRRPWQELRARRRQGIFLLPGLLTTANLACGFFAMLLTAQARWTEASVIIFVAMVMDALDGRVARAMQATSQFGIEYDSLADVVSFCVAPAFLVYAFALGGLGRAAWFAAFLFVICGALRLARFNVDTGTVDRRFFVGLPTPAAAGVVASAVLFLKDGTLTRPVLLAVAAGTFVVALLMVSTFRYWSFKEIDLARHRPLWPLLAVVLAAMIVALWPEVLPFVVFAAYAGSGPVRRLVVGRTVAPAAQTDPAREPS